MLIWRGFGILVAVITFVCMFVAQKIFNSVYGAGYYESHTWTMGMGFLVAGVLCWFLGQSFKGKGVVVIDKITKQEITLKRNHDLFYIPVRYWGVILPVIGFICIVKEYIH